MIEHQLIVSILLIVAICLLVMVSQRIKVAYPIMLVLGGIMLSFIPGIPSLRINPDVIFLVFLPPNSLRCSCFQLVERVVEMA